MFLNEFQTADRADRMDFDLVNDLENTTPNTKLATAFSFLIGVTILHEYIHYSEYTDKSWNSPESGELFEFDLYGPDRADRTDL